MARCSLDIGHPKFTDLINQDPNVKRGLEELRSKVAKDHRLSGWVPQPMQRYPEYQNKIWKWDFAPDGSTSATRKGWRIFAYVEDPKAPEPVQATAFFCYSKSNDPGSNSAKVVADALKSFLGRTVESPRIEEQFRHQIDGHGKTISLCLVCFEKVAHCSDTGEIEAAEQAHECQADAARKI